MFQIDSHATALAHDPHWLQSMTNAAIAHVDRIPTYNDLEIAHLVHCAMADVQDAGGSATARCSLPRSGPG